MIIWTAAHLVNLNMMLKLDGSVKVFCVVLRANELINWKWSRSFTKSDPDNGFKRDLTNEQKKANVLRPHTTAQYNVQKKHLRHIDITWYLNPINSWNIYFKHFENRKWLRNFVLIFLNGAFLLHTVDRAANEMEHLSLK